MAQDNSPYNEKSYVDHIPFAYLLTEAQRKEILENSNLVEYVKRDVIVKQNTPVTHIPLLVSGLVKISKEMRKGKNIIIRVAQPGSLIGLSSAFSNEIFDYSALAIDNVSIIFINSKVLKGIIETNAALGHLIIQQLSVNNIFNINKLSSLLYKQLPGRVADIILYFSEQIFKSETFSIPLTRQELAELVGTTKESLIRTLSEFNNDKIIELNRNTISITSLNILKTLSRLG